LVEIGLGEIVLGEIEGLGEIGLREIEGFGEIEGSVKQKFCW